MSKFWRILIITLLSLVVLVFGALHLVLHTELHNKIIAKITADMIDGEARVGDIRLDLREWPDFSVAIDSVSLTYPHDRFARYSRRGDPGRGVEKDTMAVMRKLKARSNYKDLRDGKITGNVEIDGLGAYLLKYTDKVSTLDIFHFPKKEKPDSAVMPYINATVELGPARVAYIDKSSDLQIQGNVELEGEGLLSSTRNKISADLDASQLSLRGDNLRVILDDMCLVAEVDDNPDKPSQPQRPAMRPRGNMPRPSRLMIPEYLREESFRESDVDVHLDENVTALLNKWHPAAALELENGLLMTTAVPLVNRVENVKLDVNMNALHVDTMNVYSGSSDVALKGTVTGLAHTLFGKGRGFWRADLDLNSQRLNVNEFLAAIKIAQKNNLPIVSDTLSDAEFYEAVAIDTLENYQKLSKPKLIVVPANVMANLNLNAGHVDFDQFDIEPLSAKINMKERCIQVSELVAYSNKGNVKNLDAYYYTKSKENIGAGFDIEITDVTADNVRAMFPKMGENVPALQTFTGDATCVAAATLQLDTNMTVLLPTMEGTVQFHAGSLSVPDMGDLKKYARLLMFRSLSDVPVHDLDISGTMSDGKIEVFPFVLGVDRYGFALTGEQKLDSDFSYRGTIIQSPMVIRSGARAYRKNQSRVKVRLSFPQFKSMDAVPTFYEEVDSLHTQIAQSVRDLSAIPTKDFASRIAKAKARKQYTYKEEDVPDNQTQEMSTRMKKAGEPPANRVKMLKQVSMKWKRSK